MKNTHLITGLLIEASIQTGPNPTDLESSTEGTPYHPCSPGCGRGRGFSGFDSCDGWVSCRASFGVCCTACWPWTPPTCQCKARNWTGVDPSLTHWRGHGVRTRSPSDPTGRSNTDSKPLQPTPTGPKMEACPTIGTRRPATQTGNAIGSCLILFRPLQIQPNPISSLRRPLWGPGPTGSHLVYGATLGPAETSFGEGNQSVNLSSDLGQHKLPREPPEP